MSKKKSSKKKHSASVVKCITITLGVIAIALAALYAFLRVDWKTLNEEELTTELVVQRANAAMDSYKYASSIIDYQSWQAGEAGIGVKYCIAHDHENSHYTYMYSDSEDNAYYQYCGKDTSAQTYNVYTYSSLIDAWVLIQQGTPPMQPGIWNILDGANEYFLLQETDNWYNTGEECYVLEMYGSTEEWQNVYEAIYIRKADYVPLGIISYATQDTGVPATSDIHDIVIEGNEGEAATPQMLQNEILEKTEIAFSNESLDFFGVPEEYITEEDYKAIMEVFGDGE